MNEPAAILKKKKPRSPLVQILVRGLAISLPTILTVVILIWIARGVNTYIIYPATATVKWVTARLIDDSIPVEGLTRLTRAPSLDYCGDNYLLTQELAKKFRAPLLENEPQRDATWLMTKHSSVPGIYVPLGKRAVPYDDYVIVAQVIPRNDLPTTATGIYMEVATQRYFGQVFHLTLVAILLIFALLYFLGRLVNVKVGRWIVAKLESNILGRLPVVRNVYGSVKQVTDFLFTESEIEYRRVVAIQYPRRGIWSLAFVTGESMRQIHDSVGEPCVAVLVPTSPMPMTGYSMSLPRSEVLDLDLTVEQAMQFIISCGVLTPPHQKVSPPLIEEEVLRNVSGSTQHSRTSDAEGEGSSPGGALEKPHAADGTGDADLSPMAEVSPSNARGSAS